MNEELLRAAEYIDTHGWCQHNIHDDEGRVCLSGAIIKANGAQLNGTFEHFRAYLQTVKYIMEYPDELNSTKNHLIVPFVNDNILTSAEEASKLLREAAEWDAE